MSHPKRLTMVPYTPASRTSDLKNEGTDMSQHQRTSVSFRVVVDVDIDGHIDPPDRSGKTANVNCVPW